MSRLALADLVARRSNLELLLRELDEEPAQRGAVHLELGVLAKLLDGLEGIGGAFEHLRAALRLLPPDASAARQRALFVLGLTHGDVSEPALAVERFEEVNALDQSSQAGSAARAYANTYREHFKLDPR